MKDDRSFFPYIPELGNIKKRFLKKQSAACPLKLAEISLPVIRQCRTVNLSGKGPLFLETLCSYLCGWFELILLDGRMLSYAKSHKENGKRLGNNREMHQTEEDRKQRRTEQG